MKYKTAAYLRDQLHGKPNGYDLAVIASFAVLVLAYFIHPLLAFGVVWIPTWALLRRCLHLELRIRLLEDRHGTDA